MEAGTEGWAGLNSKFQNSNFKEECDLIAAIKDWLPIAVRNRVALGFAVSALVMFVTWNLLPNYDRGRLLFNFVVWPDLINPDLYISVIRSPNMEGFLLIAFCMSLLLNGLLVLMIVPFWKILHCSNYLRIPLAVVNFAGGLVILLMIFRDGFDYSVPYRLATLVLIELTLFALSAALFIFKNELGLRHDLEVKKTMAGE